MNSLFLCLERASLFGLGTLVVALGAQGMLDGRVPASWRVWVWRIALLQSAFALVPLVPIGVDVLPSPPAKVEPIHPFVAAPRSSPVPSENSKIAPATLPTVRAVAFKKPFSASPTARRFPVQASLLALYLVGLGVQLLWLGYCFARLRGLLRVCSPVENAGLKAELCQVACKMGVSPLPDLLQSEDHPPFLVGIVRPTIVLPRHMVDTRSADLVAVLSHELAHLKRRDLAWNAVLWFVQSLLWFHPLVWIARRFLALETECACDERVLSSTGVTPRAYGALLLNTMNTPATPLSAGMTDGFFALKTRLRRLGQAPKRPGRRAKLTFVAALCLAFGAAVPLRLVARAQQAPRASGLKPGAAKSKIQLIPGSYRVRGNVPRDDTPEAQVGLPARLEDARGNATITGRVVDAKGKPIAGVRISTFCVWVTQTELWGYHRTQANHYRWPAKIDRLLSAEATTRTDGSYRFTGLLPQWYHIHLRGDNYGNRAPAGYMAPYRGVGVTAVANRTVRSPDTVLQRSAQIRIRAVDADSGAPLEGVMFLGFIVNEHAGKITDSTVDAHRKLRPSTGFYAERATDKNGYCTLDLNGGKAYFFMRGGVYMGSPAGEKAASRFGLPDRFITTQGLYKSEAWCQVTELSPQASQAPRRSWKGETEFQLQRGPAANFTVRLKLYKPLTPAYKSLLQMIKRRF